MPSYGATARAQAAASIRAPASPAVPGKAPPPERLAHRTRQPSPARRSAMPRPTMPLAPAISAVFFACMRKASSAERDAQALDEIAPGLAVAQRHLPERLAMHLRRHAARASHGFLEGGIGLH